MALPDVGSPVLPGDRVIVYIHSRGLWLYAGVATSKAARAGYTCVTNGGKSDGGIPFRNRDIAPDYCPVRQTEG